MEIIKMLARLNRAFYFRASFIVHELFKKRSLVQFYRVGRAALKVLLERD
jgi:hypothetical protein